MKIKDSVLTLKNLQTDDTSYYLINKNSKPIYFGYSFASEGDIIRTDLNF